MRRDIAKVVYERAKSGRTWASKTPRPVAVQMEPDGETHNELAQTVRLQRQKRTSLRVQSVERFLMGQIGKPWTRVWSELAAVLDPRNTLGAEIRDLVGRMVETHCWLDGRTVTASHPGRSVKGFYVHPKSGLLQQTPDRPRRKT